MRTLTFLLLFAFALIRSTDAAVDSPEMAVEHMHFAVDGKVLSGLYSAPESGAAHALVIIVHGYGRTNVVRANSYLELRVRLARRGIASFVWDKPGCGDSEGMFDPNQPVASSASEVVAAAHFLRAQNTPGADQIGLWGISRAGWIAPLVLARDKALAFWISVSGVDDKESFGYLLASNWRVVGYNQQTIDKLLGQWMRGNAIVLGAGTYSEYVAATQDYHADPFVQFVSGRDRTISEKTFNAWRESWISLSPNIDPDTGLTLYVNDFPELLSELDVPVLALFGEKDTSVDWRAARELYKKTIGKNADAVLTIRTFANGNHNLHVSETGSFREMMQILKNPQMVPGYYDTMLLWLDGVTRETTSDPVDF